MRAIRISRWGGPEALEYVEDAPAPQPGPHELLVEVSRAGVNFADSIRARTAISRATSCRSSREPRWRAPPRTAGAWRP